MVGLENVRRPLRNCRMNNFPFCRTYRSYFVAWKRRVTSRSDKKSGQKSDKTNSKKKVKQKKSKARRTRLARSLRNFAMKAGEKPVGRWLRHEVVGKTPLWKQH